MPSLSSSSSYEDIDRYNIEVNISINKWLFVSISSWSYYEFIRSDIRSRCRIVEHSLCLSAGCFEQSNSFKWLQRVVIISELQV